MCVCEFCIDAMHECHLGWRTDASSLTKPSTPVYYAGDMSCVYMCVLLLILCMVKCHVFVCVLRRSTVFSSSIPRMHAKQIRWTYLGRLAVKLGISNVKERGV